MGKLKDKLTLLKQGKIKEFVNTDLADTKDKLKNTWKQFKADPLGSNSPEALAAKSFYKSVTDTDVSGAEAATTKKTIKSVAKDIFLYPRAKKISTYSDRKIKKKS